MKLSRKWIVLAALVLSVAMATTGTVAYLSDTASEVNVMTMGSVKIEQIEQERDANGKLVDFTQGKPAMPAVGEIAYDDELFVVNGENVRVFGTKIENVIDKFVTVNNTGKSDAYLRTIIAIEAPNGDPEDLIHFNANYGNEGEYTQVGNPFVTKIDGTDFYVMNLQYNKVLKAGEKSAPSLMQLFLDSKADNDDCAAFGDTWEVLVVSQAVQAAGFADAETALNAAFGAITAENHPWTETVFEEAKDNASFENAVTGDKKEIVVNLTSDVTYDVAAWAANGMGAETTENIVINGNGHTITFYQTNSDWNNIVTNGAKLTIVNAKITNAGHNDGPWNRHDLNFNCDVELNNVISDKAMAFKAGAKLTNVTINDKNTADTYAIWVQPNGQTVTLNNCTIDMLDCSDGRGLKIDEQYVSAPEKVTLVVKNTTFKTEEKSAILVKSAAGADITLENVDITGVVADSTNPVWVDEASSAYYDLVKVTGGTKVQE